MAQVGATALFLMLGSVGSFLLGIEVAARPISTMVGSANGATDVTNSQVFQADGSLGSAANSARRSAPHVKVGGKNSHGQSGQHTGSQGQPPSSSGQTPPPTPPGAGSGAGAGTSTSGTPPADGSGPGASTPPGTDDGSIPGSTSGTPGTTPGTGAPDASGNPTADSGSPVAAQSGAPQSMTGAPASPTILG